MSSSRPSSSRPSVEPIPAIQREIERISQSGEVRSALDWLRQQEAQFVRWQLELARIPAPPFGEEQRAEWLAAKFNDLGLVDIQKDEIGNVVGLLPAAGDPHGFVSISAHLDTVFPPNTPLHVRHQGNRLYGPSVSDNAAGVTALLAIAAVFAKLNLRHEAPLLFVGNVGEEGEGDLRGMRHIFCESPWKDRIGASVILDGAGCDTIVAEALGSRRFEVVIRGPGGHSWSDFGAPNPIVAL